MLKNANPPSRVKDMIRDDPQLQQMSYEAKVNKYIAQL